ncbi:MAG: sugar ABC transporter ATP-binding protein [Actinomycetota bacterium]
MALLEVERIRKSYPGVKALAGVDLVVEAGEVHALLGENGAGKSTLMKVIAGAVRPDGGRMSVDGADFHPGSPDEARTRGIGIVYQDLSLVPTLSVGENVMLGRWPRTRLGVVDWKRLHRESTVHLRRIGFDVDTRARTSRLGMAERQLVEIAKALAASAVEVLLLDEPTSALSERESSRLFEVVADLRERGVAIVYVSHRLKEIMHIADRITVLRDGRRIQTVSVTGVDEAQLATMMVGHRVGDAADHSPAPGGAGEIALKVAGLARPPRLKGVDFELHAGEVVAIFGLVGAGRTRLARTLFGLEPATAGSIEVGGRRTTIASPVDAIACSIGYLGEDRSSGIVPRMSVASNVTLATLDEVSRGPLLDFGRERQIARRYVHELSMRVGSVDDLAETLSGGNQQKALLARWLCSVARVLILDDPTRGVDVGAKEEVFRLVRQLAGEGVAILYLTSEVKEAKALSHRVLVMSDGRIVKELESSTPEDEIVAAAGGAHG